MDIARKKILIDHQFKQ